MKNIALAGVSVLVVFGLCQGVTALKPTMNPSESEIVIQEGDELRLECRGEGRMQFSVQKAGYKTNNPRFDIVEEESSGAYTLIINSTKKEDTRWYACADESVLIRNDEQNIDHESNDIAWIYVYVNSSAPFAIDIKYTRLVAVPGDRVVVPCRPTSPNLTVRLEVTRGATELPENTTYDPKIGFILNGVGQELSGLNFGCQVDGSERMTSYILNVVDPNDRYISVDVVGSNSITANEAEHALWIIKVRINNNQSTHSENVTWEWHKPNGEMIVPTPDNRYLHTVYGSYHFFEISKLNVEDNGNNTIKFSTEEDEKIIILQLTVVTSQV